MVKKDGFIYEDVVQLMPAYSTSVDMMPDNPGTWLFHCHVNDHVEAGMIATYSVSNRSCTQCVGRGDSLDDGSNANDDSIGEVLSSKETWIIIVVCFVMNWMGAIAVWTMYRYCCFRNRKGRGTKVANSDLTQRMLTQEDQDMEMQQPL